MNQQHEPQPTDPFAPPQPRPQGYDAMRRTLVWGDLGRRSVLMARGPDAVRFIDNFTTASVSSLSTGGGCEGFFADARGWVFSLTTILRTDDGVWIDAPAGVAAGLREHLDRYHIRERVELTDESDVHEHLISAGPQAATWLAERCSLQPPQELLGHGCGLLGGVPVTIVRVDWFGAEGFLVQTGTAQQARLVAWMEAQDLARAGAATWETARIETGTPQPVDIPEKTLPQELARGQRAISFTKGCYLGQETVARIDALGHVNRRFVAIAIDERLGKVHPWQPVSGAIVRCGGDVIGRLTSVCFSPVLRCSLGLGLMQTKAIDSGKPLEVEGETARVVALPLSHEQVTQEDRAIDEQPDAGEVLLETKRFRVVRVSEPAGDGDASGSRRHREIVRHPGSVVIVPMVSPREVCLVEVVRVAVGRTLLELPAGTLDRVESLEEAARRELAEETGYRAGRIMSAGAMWMSPGILRERMHLFVAEDLVAGPQALEPGEQIRARVVAWDEAIAMCLDGRIDDAKTIAGLLLTAARRR